MQASHLVSKLWRLPPGWNRRTYAEYVAGVIVVFVEMLAFMAFGAAAYAMFLTESAAAGSDEQKRYLQDGTKLGVAAVLLWAGAFAVVFLVGRIRARRLRRDAAAPAQPPTS